MISYVSRYARYFEIVSIIFGLLLTCIFFTKWTFGSLFGYSLLTHDAWVAYSQGTSQGIFLLDSMPFTHRIAGCLIDGIGLLLMLLGFYYAIRIMQCFKRGPVFSLQTLSLFQTLTKIAILHALFSPVQHTLLTLIGSLQNQPGQRYLVIGFGTQDLINILVFLFFFVITSIMKEGYQLQEEHDFTV